MSNGNPELRPVEVIPFREGGRELVCLRDPSGLAPDPVVVDAETFFIISMFDGRHTVLDMQEATIRRFGSLLFSDRIRDIIRELDDHRLLLTPEFIIFREALIEEFAASAVREARGAGTSYSDDPTELAHMLGAILKGVPAVNVTQRPGRLSGLIAPHIDYARGGVAYAHAYREVEPLDAPQLVLLLGTSHAPTENRFVLTRKRFATPFGQATTDVEFVEALAAKLPFDAFADEFVHRNEHSIELEVIWLKYLLRQPDALRIVPVLCGSFEGLLRAGRSPGDDELLSEGSLDELSWLGESLSLVESLSDVLEEPSGEELPELPLLSSLDDSSLLLSELSSQQMY